MKVKFLFLTAALAFLYPRAEAQTIVDRSETPLTSVKSIRDHSFTIAWETTAKRGSGAADSFMHGEFMLDHLKCDGTVFMPFESPSRSMIVGNVEIVPSGRCESHQPIFMDLTQDSHHRLFLISFRRRGKEIEHTMVMSSESQIPLEGRKIYWFGYQSQNHSYDFIRDIKIRYNDHRLYPLLACHDRDEETFQILKDRFTQTRAACVKNEILRWMAWIDHAGVLPFLDACYHSDSNEELKECLFATLGRISGPEAAGRLYDYIVNPWESMALRHEALFYYTHHREVSSRELRSLYEQLDVRTLKREVLHCMYEMAAETGNRGDADPIKTIIFCTKECSTLRKDAIRCYSQLDFITVKDLVDVYMMLGNADLKKEMMNQIQAEGRGNKFYASMY